jgi:ribonuclease J
VWSLWDGYLSDASGQRLQTTLSAAGLELVHHHTSGHASAADLARLQVAIAPGRTVPIHTQHPASVPGAEGTNPADGVWWEIRA